MTTDLYDSNKQSYTLSLIVSCYIYFQKIKNNQVKPERTLAF